jgi:two-component system response regulator
VPVIMLTTSSHDEDIVRSYGKGVCSFITKPVSLGEFNELVSRFSLYWALVAKIPRLHQEICKVYFGKP